MRKFTFTPGGAGRYNEIMTCELRRLLIDTLGDIPQTGNRLHEMSKVLDVPERTLSRMLGAVGISLQKVKGISN